MAICENLAQHLNGIRKERQLTISEFAEELGISRSSLQALLNGTGNPRTDTIEYLATQLDADPIWLISAQKDEQSFPKPLTPQQLSHLLALLEHLNELLGEKYE